ncbi:MAG: prepilin-type N-terminal cleavage/methylation domain-containing protein [Acidiphilium sp.]|nr:prepilin-type N-terminal cleavage/methylation domain-containing protein [Acidiphilium sp.]MDD4935624.1 prepilin-type N-terminal cleavage/methylation domain-containing protein [Acidiphilium sp.]
MKHDAGFSLMEMIVALVVLGLLLAGLAQAIRFGLGTYARESAILVQSGRQAAVDRALRRLIEQARPGQAAGGPGLLRLITTLPQATAWAGRAIDAAVYVDPRHDLVLAWSPHLPGIALHSAAPPQVEVLARGVAGLSIGYWWPKTVFGAPAWQSRGPAGGLPLLIRLRITLRHHEPWPDLIAAPALAAAH